MRRLTRLFTARRFAPKRAPLSLESLDRRDLPALLFVVPGNVATDGTHFHDLSDAIGAANSSDTIQIEPNSAPGNADGTNGTNPVNNYQITIQGDPADGPSDLPQIPSLEITSPNAKLNNLNLGTVTIQNGTSGVSVENSFVVSVGSVSGYNFSIELCTISGDTISGPVSLASPANNVAEIGDNRVVNNHFINNGYLLAQGQTNILVQGNTFTSIAALDIAVFGFGQATISHNTIAVSGNIVGIEVNNSGGDATDGGGGNTTATIADNSIDTNGQGTGIALTKYSTGNLTVSVSGNATSRNFVGITVTGDGTSNGYGGGIDLGGGPLSSAGGNDFHGFNGTGGHFAIAINNEGVGVFSTVYAEDELFTGTPSADVQASQGILFTTNELSANASFVQTLYTKFLDRTGSAGELAGWNGTLAGTNGNTSVATQLVHSTEAEGDLVTQLYVTILGRSPMGNEDSSWVNMLQSGATEEQVIAGLLSSAEYAGRDATLITSPSLSPNTNYVQSLYATLLGRSGSPSEIDYWVSQLPSQGRAGVAQMIMGSSEFRTNLVEAMYSGSPGIRGHVPLADLVPDLLNRSAVSASDVSSWVNSGYDLLKIESMVGGSAEAFGNG